MLRLILDLDRSSVLLLILSYGHIGYRVDLLINNHCKFRTKENIVKDYSPSDISAFRFIESKYYV